MQGPGPIAPLLLLVSLGALGASSAAQAQHGAPGWTIQAVGELVEGKQAEAVAAVGRARAIKATPEQDALVGLAALAGGQLEAAQRNFEAAIKRGSTEPLVFYWAARAALARGALALAQRRLQEAIAVGGDLPQLRMGQAIVLAAAGRHEAARGALKAVAARGPNLLDPSLYPTPVEGAIELLGRMLRRFPGQRELQRTQGHLLWRAGRILAAQRRFEALLAQSSGDQDALQMLARCLVALRRATQGLELANRALRQAPKDPQALATRGEILLELGRAAEATQDLRAAADAFPRDGRLLARLAQACTEAERPACAAKFFRYAIRREPAIAAAHFGVALHLQQAGQHEQARAAFLRAMALDPGDPRFARAAAAFALQRNDRRWAAQLLGRARRLQQEAARRSRRLTSIGAQLERQIAALEAVAASTRCEPDCVKKVSRAPEPARSFIQAHLALGAGHEGRALTLLSGLVPRLRASRLLGRDPVEFVTDKRSKSGAALPRIYLPLVPPAAF